MYDLFIKKIIKPFHSEVMTKFHDVNQDPFRKLVHLTVQPSNVLNENNRKDQPYFDIITIN